MSPADIETARAFVACPGWAWLPGMQAMPDDPRNDWTGTVRIVAIDAPFIICGDGSRMRQAGRVPDLDDPLTRAGLLVIVRRALGGEGVFAPFVAPVVNPHEPGVAPHIEFAVWYCGVPRFRGETEPLALLAALQVSPAGGAA